MFADDANLFYSHKDINALFLKVSNKLHKTNQWFISNKLSLNIKNTKYSFFHKRNKKPPLLPKLKINNYEIKRAESIKLLGVLLDENLTWKPHIRYIEKKIAKNIGLLVKAKPFLNKILSIILLYLHYSCIHSYIDYVNVAWRSTYMTYKYIYNYISSQQKQAMRVICNKGKFETTKQLFQSNKIHSAYKLNILTFFFPMFPFDPPENIRKHLVF